MEAQSVAEILTRWPEEARAAAELVEKSFSTANVFRQLGDDSVAGTVGALGQEPGTVIDSLAKNPELDAVMSAALTILDFKTQAVRDIEAGQIKSIIEPRLADHVRREALKFLNELSERSEAEGRRSHRGGQVCSLACSLG